MGLIKKVKVIGIDDPPDVIASIGKGEAWGSFNQNFQKQGYEAVRNIVDYYRKKPFIYNELSLSPMFDFGN